MENDSSHRVAFFLPDLDGGGAERVMVQLANSFDSRGIKVDFLLAKAVGARLGDLAPGVRVLQLGGRGVLAALPGLVGYLRRTAPEALLSSLDHANLVAAWSGVISGRRTRVVLRQAMDPSGLSPVGLAAHLIGRLMGPSYRIADHVVVLADGMRETMLRSKRLDPRRVSIVPNPVSAERIRTLASQPVEHPWLTDLPEGTHLIVAAGRLQPQKDFAMLLRAVEKAARVTPVRLAILGEGPERPYLTALAEDLGIGDHTLLPGFQANPYPWLARAEVVALSSRAEGMPNVLLEAMALGKPIVATDCPSGPRELLEGGRLGRLVPVGDESALAAAILTVLAGERPPESVLREAVDCYGIDAVADRYLAILVSDATRQRST